MSHTWVCSLGLVLLAIGPVSSPASSSADASRPAEITSAEQLIEAHLTAIGGRDKWESIRTLTYLGPYEEGGHRAVHRFDRKRPGWIRVTTNYVEETGEYGYAEGFDGAAWEYSQGVPVRVTGMPARALRHAASFDPPYFDLRRSGDAVQFLGRVRLRDREVYQLRLTGDDGSTDHYFDARTYLKVMSVSRVPLHGEGRTLEILTTSSDFRPVAGVLMAHRSSQEELESGRLLSVATWDRIEANRELPDEWFSPPPAPEAILYDEFRTAILAGRSAETSDLYAAYRDRCRRQLETRWENELNTLGYELLSHERFEDAIEIFKMALANHPASSNLHDSLGEALMLAGRFEEAIESYRTAHGMNPSNRHAVEMIETMQRQLEADSPSEAGPEG